MLREDVETFFCRKFATLPGVVAMYGVGTVDGVVFVKKGVYQIEIYLMHPLFHFSSYRNSSGCHILRVSLKSLFFRI